MEYAKKQVPSPCPIINITISFLFRLFDLDQVYVIKSW